MKLHRFYTAININKGGINSLPDHSLIHQVENVLRLKSGDRIVLFDGSGRDFESEIISLNKNEMTFRVVDTKNVKRNSPMKLSLVFSLIKKDNMELVVQKCTELGVTEFIPVISERSEKKGFNLERAKKISIEACEQSGRGDVPEIYEPTKLENFLQNEKRKILVFHTSHTNYTNHEDHKNENTFDKNSFSRETELVICIGPEGGWSEKEISMFIEKGASISKLDTPILRAETAAIAVSAILLF